MARLQLRVLFREFLFRMVDLELLSAQGDITELLGRFAALLAFISSTLGLGGLMFSAGRMQPARLAVTMWGMEHFLIATTMLVVGLFAVLSWDSAFPDRRDVLVLAPLPIRPRTLFAAKAAALAASLSLTVVSLNGISGTIWSLHFIAPDSGFVGLLRAEAAFWITVFASGAFVFCAVLGLQGLAAQLPRRIFLRLSGLLQIGAFCLFLSGYFLEPSLYNPRALAAPENQRLLTWLPSYWFLGLFHWLNGSMHPAYAPLVGRALRGTALAALLAGTVFLLSYFRTLRKIVEEPDIVAGAGGGMWLPRFGDALHTAVVQFSIRTLLRSRQHRMILSFYLGVGFAFVTLFLKTPHAREQMQIVEVGLGAVASAPMLLASLLMVAAWMVGARMVFAMPLDLGANWIYRVMPLGGAWECLSASRRALYVLSVVPSWLGCAALFFPAWPWRSVAGHLAILGLLSMILAEVLLHNFPKIPFTCSYMPGRTQIHMAFVSGLFLLLAMGDIMPYELQILADAALLGKALLVLGAAAAGIRWWTDRRVKQEGEKLRFEEEAQTAVLALGLGKG